MTVAELVEWLSQRNPRSPLCIMGIGPGGESIMEWDVDLGTGQGPSDDIDEVIISWVHTPEAEALYNQAAALYRQRHERR